MRARRKYAVYRHFAETIEVSVRICRPFNLNPFLQEAKMKSNFITTLTFLVLGTLSLATAADADGLLEIKVKGTNIDRFPNYVEVITSNPRGAAATLYAAGGRNLEKDTRFNERFTVFHHEVLHIFYTVDDYKTMLHGHSFKDGDVVYKYFLDSEADEKDFVKRYGLETTTPDARLGDLPVALYSTTPGFYVSFLVNLDLFSDTSTIHPARYASRYILAVPRKGATMIGDGIRQLARLSSIRCILACSIVRGDFHPIEHPNARDVGVALSRRARNHWRFSLATLFLGVTGVQCAGPGLCWWCSHQFLSASPAIS
jgi:hypothetical protein